MPAVQPHPSPAPDALPGHGDLPLPYVYAVFFFSGFAALVYQVVWQRSLFAIYGVNIESVTIVVAAFMLGLGLGSTGGGALSARPNAPLLRWFAAVEASIGLYGLASLHLFRAVGGLTAGASGAATFALTFALVLIPTSLMGATLPLLVAHAVKRSGNVGKSVGMLYFTNTLGSAVASFAAAVLLLGKLGQTKTVYVAALANFGVAGAVWWLDRRARLQKSPELEQSPVAAPEVP